MSAGASATEALRAAPAASPSGPTWALVNPMSFRMRLAGQAPECIALLQRNGVSARQVAALEQIESSLEQAVADGCRRLVIASGDGTIQAAVSWLERHVGADALPEIVLLAAGRTNYIAAELGLRRLDALQSLLADPEQGRVQRCRTLVCEHPSLPMQSGFFMAGALVDQLIRHAHREQARGGSPLRQRMASLIGIARPLLSTRQRLTLPEVEVIAEGLGRLHGRCRFLLATTLELADRWPRPYADRGRGAVRCTAIGADAQRWVLRLPRILSGRHSEDMHPGCGYLSGANDRIRIRGLPGITLDGQEFDLDPGEILTLRGGPEWRFRLL